MSRLIIKNHETSVEINGIDYAKNDLQFQIFYNEDVGIMLTRGNKIIYRVPYDEISLYDTNGTKANVANLNAFKAKLRTFFFRKLTSNNDSSGSGGGATNASELLFISTSGNINSSNVQDAIEEVYAAIPSQISINSAKDVPFENEDTGISSTDVHDALLEIDSKIGSGEAKDIAFEPITGVTAQDNVQDALEEIYDTIDSLDASVVSFEDGSEDGLEATTVEEAILEVDDKVNNIKAADISFQEVEDKITSSTVQDAILETDNKHHGQMHQMASVLDHFANENKLFYSDSNGKIQELALGEKKQALISGGVDQPPEWVEVKEEDICKNEFPIRAKLLKRYYSYTDATIYDTAQFVKYKKENDTYMVYLSTKTTQDAYQCFLSFYKNNSSTPISTTVINTYYVGRLTHLPDFNAILLPTSNGFLINKDDGTGLLNENSLQITINMPAGEDDYIENDRQYLSFTNMVYHYEVEDDQNFVYLTFFIKFCSINGVLNERLNKGCLYRLKLKNTSAGNNPIEIEAYTHIPVRAFELDVINPKSHNLTTCYSFDFTSAGKNYELYYAGLLSSSPSRRNVKSLYFLKRDVNGRLNMDFSELSMSISSVAAEFPLSSVTTFCYMKSEGLYIYSVDINRQGVYLYELNSNLAVLRAAKTESYLEYTGYSTYISASTDYNRSAYHAIHDIDSNTIFFTSITVHRTSIVYMVKYDIQNKKLEMFDLNLNFNQMVQVVGYDHELKRLYIFNTTYACLEEYELINNNNI